MHKGRKTQGPPIVEEVSLKPAVILGDAISNTNHTMSQWLQLLCLLLLFSPLSSCLSSILPLPLSLSCMYAALDNPHLVSGKVLL